MDHTQPRDNQRPFKPYIVGEQFFFKSVPRRTFKSLEDEQQHKISQKLQFRYSGPHTIVGTINPLVYRATVDGILRTVHANRMKRDPRKRPPLLHVHLTHLHTSGPNHESQQTIRNLPCPPPHTEWDMYHGLQQHFRSKMDTNATWLAASTITSQAARRRSRFSAKQQQRWARHKTTPPTLPEQPQLPHPIYSNLGMVTAATIPRDHNHQYSIDQEEEQEPIVAQAPAHPTTHNPMPRNTQLAPAHSVPSTPTRLNRPPAPAHPINGTPLGNPPNPQLRRGRKRNHSC